MEWKARLVHLRSHLTAGVLPADDLFGGAGFTDAVGIRAKPKPKPTRRQELMQLIKEAGLEKNVEELDREGWTVIHGALGEDLTRRLRARILEVTADQLNKKRRSGLRFAQLGSLLYHGREFEEACQCPKQMLLAEYMLGASYNVWQYLCSVRGRGTGGLPVHNDLGGGWRQPFAAYPEMCTSLLICDDFDAGETPGQAGGTFVVPGTHHLRRNANLENEDDRALIAERAVPIMCKAGSVAMWHSGLWHGSLPRRLPGERVVCSYANTRVHFRSSDDYSELSEEVIARNPPRFRTMIGRDTGYMELGKDGGVLFGGARMHGRMAKLAKEEEALPELDPHLRIQQACQ